MFYRNAKLNTNCKVTFKKEADTHVFDFQFKCKNKVIIINSKLHALAILNIAIFISACFVHVYGFSQCYNEAEKASIPGKLL